MDIPCSGISPAYLPLSNTATTNNHSRSPSDGSTTSVSTSLKRTVICFSEKPLVVPSKPRSKRSRTGRSVWSFRHPFLIEPICASSVSSSSSSTSSAFVLESKPINPEDFVAFSPVVLSRGRGRPPLHKKKNPLGVDQQLKKKKGRKSKVTTTTTTTTTTIPTVAAELFMLETGDVGANGRRCSHCGVQKTPQWRAGPMGSKTLCNACGVRYKSGRLLPEYRPAISPTFLDHVHSNSHRKVLEMRRKKEVQVQFKQQPLESASPPCHLPAAQATSQPPIVFWPGCKVRNRRTKPVRFFSGSTLVQPVLMYIAPILAFVTAVRTHDLEERERDIDLKDASVSVRTLILPFPFSLFFFTLLNCSGRFLDQSRLKRPSLFIVISKN